MQVWCRARPPCRRLRSLSSSPHNNQKRSTDLNNTLLNNMLQKENPSTLHTETSTSNTTTEDSPPPVVQKGQGLQYLITGVPIYFGLWVVTCGSIYTAVKTGNLHTESLFGMDRSYAVEKIVSSMEWYSGKRPTAEQIANPEINNALLALSITKLTSPFRLLVTIMLMNRPDSSPSSNK